MEMNIKTLEAAVNTSTNSPVGSDAWNEQFQRMFGLDAHKAYLEEKAKATPTEEKKAGWSTGKKVAVVTAGAIGSGLLGFGGVLLYRKFGPGTAEGLMKLIR